MKGKHERATNHVNAKVTSKKKYYDVLKALPPTSISISSLTFKPIKHMNTEGKMGQAHWIHIY